MPYPAAAYPAPPAPYGAPPAGNVSEHAVELLRQTRPWVLFLSVLFFLASGFMLLAGLGMVALGAATTTDAAKFSPALIGLVYVPLAFLYVYPAIKLWKYGSAIGQLVASRSAADLEAALGQQKSFWKYSGIAAIVVIVLYVVVFGVALAIGVASGLGKM
jgi:hypothetical protein